MVRFLNIDTTDTKIFWMLHDAGSNVREKERESKILQKFDPVCYNRCSVVHPCPLPKSPAELTLNETVITLTELFGLNMSLITFRWDNYLKVQYVRSVIIRQLYIGCMQLLKFLTFYPTKRNAFYGYVIWTNQNMMKYNKCLWRS